jgi:protein-tyrosine phosphatase
MKILMVCLGNICRSPIAEGVLRRLAFDAGIQHVSVDSCGFERYHLGDPPDNRAIAVCKKHDINISSLRQRLFKNEDFALFDKIYVMDNQNYKDVIQLAQNEEQVLKVDYLLNNIDPGTNKSVPDPYYGNSDDFESAFILIEKACKTIIRSIISPQ